MNSLRMSKSRSTHGRQIEMSCQKPSSLPDYRCCDESDLRYEHADLLAYFTLQRPALIGDNGDPREGNVLDAACRQSTTSGKDPNRLIETEAFFAATHRRLQRHHANKE